MAETSVIAQMAEKISDELFSQFLWNKIGPVNQNWLCKNSEEHKVETHPSDVVFWYDEPYQNTTTYVQCDLKSYAADSISKSSVNVALKSLSQQISCADVCPEWQAKYTNSSTTYDVAGLLFIYNHDGGYDRSFSDIINKIKIDKLDIPRNKKIVVLGPADIYWLNNVATDIMRLRGNSKLPTIDRCSFFYPQPVRRAQIRSAEKCAATLEMLTGPWIILRYETQQQIKGLVIFYRSPGATLEEFLYLIDFLRQHDVLSGSMRVEIRTLDASKMSTINFQKAQQKYVAAFDEGDDSKGLAEEINNISLNVISHTISTFSENQIGMEYAR